MQPYRYQPSWGGRQALHFGAGVVAAATGSSVLALAALASFDAEFSGRRQWLARLLPTGEGANVVGRVPAAGERVRTLVLVAHHDAAQTGFVWRHRKLFGSDTASRAALQEVAFLLAATRSRRARAVAAGLLAFAAVTALDVARSPTVPGANDNATGVAAVLALVERFAAEPLPGTEVVALFPGSEESGMGGMRAWLDAAAPDPSTTFVLGLDTLGSGNPVVLTAEGPPRPVRYRERDLALVEGARRVRLGGWTDPALAAIDGIPAVSILSMRDGAFTNYHVPSDLPEHVDWGSVDACLDVAHATALRWASGRP